tara:strand:+ start:1022 stop:1315 length:294 start_codon:yes stop_codon:yes gene_type:complete
MSKFEIGFYKNYGDGLGNFNLQIKNITKMNKLSFIMFEYHEVQSWYNKKFCRDIQTDNEGNEYLNIIYYDKEIGDGFKLEAKEINKYKYNPEEEEDE